MKDTATIDSLTVFRIISKPAATDTCLGQEGWCQKNVLVFDLEGGLSWSVLTIQDGITDVKSTTEDTSWSEEYLDNQVVNLIHD